MAPHDATLRERCMMAFLLYASTLVLCSPTSLSVSLPPSFPLTHSLTDPDCLRAVCVSLCRYVALPTMTFNDDTVAWVMENVVLKGEDIVPDNVSLCVYVCLCI